MGDVNVVTRRGKHTTTAAVWIPFGRTARSSTPRAFASSDSSASRSATCRGSSATSPRVAPGCRYPDCLHLHEPSCAVDAAVEDGEIAAFRYESYLRILEGLDEVR